MMGPSRATHGAINRALARYRLDADDAEFGHRERIGLRRARRADGCGTRTGRGREPACRPPRHDGRSTPSYPLHSTDTHSRSTPNCPPARYRERRPPWRPVRMFLWCRLVAEAPPAPVFCSPVRRGHSRVRSGGTFVPAMMQPVSVIVCGGATGACANAVTADVSAIPQSTAIFMVELLYPEICVQGSRHGSRSSFDKLSTSPTVTSVALRPRIPS